MRKPLVLLALALALSGCLNDGGYRVASIFFDGVPAPAEKKGDAPVATKVPADDKGAPEAAVTTAAPAPAVPAVFTHSPYAKGSCRSCHDVKASNTLVKTGNDLCFTCHTTILTGKKVVHAAAMSDCLICHDPHRSGTEKLLVKKVPDLCLDCHERDKMEEKHGEIADCRSCHNPHEADSDSLLEFK